MHLALDDALTALATLAARPAPTDRRVLARHADFWRFSLGRGLEPVDATLPFAALCSDGRALVGLLVETAMSEPSMRAAIEHRLRAADERHPSLPPPARRVFIAAAARIAPALPADVVRRSAVRRAELLRRWAAFNEVPIRFDGVEEPASRSARILKRLDYTIVRAEEERLARTQAVAEARREALARIAAGGAL